MKRGLWLLFIGMAVLLVGSEGHSAGEAIPSVSLRLEVDQQSARNRQRDQDHYEIGDGADLGAGHSDYDDGIHPYHHCTFVYATGSGYAADAAESASGRTRAVSYVFYNGALLQ